MPVNVTLSIPDVLYNRFRDKVFIVDPEDPNPPTENVVVRQKIRELIRDFTLRTELDDFKRDEFDAFTLRVQQEEARRRGELAP